MAILTICNHKGGTGKTTTVMHLAAALGMSGYRVLVIDLDPQSFLTRMLGVEEPPEEKSALVMFDLDASLSDVPKINLGEFELLPSSTGLTRMMRRLNRPTDVFRLKETLGGGEAYDLILIDTAVAITVYSLNALVASSYALIPVTPEYQPVLGAEQTFQTCKLVQDKLNPDLQDPWLIFTQVDGRKRNHLLYRKYLRGLYGAQVMESIIRTNAALSRLRKDGKTVFNDNLYSRGARDYANATDELLGLIAIPDRTEVPQYAAAGNAPPFQRLSDYLQ